MFKQYDAYQDSNNLELPIVPVGWKVDRIKYEIKLLTGYPFNSSKYTEEGIKLVRGINVKESVLDWKDTAYWPEATPDLQRYLLKDCDLLIGMDGSKVGKNFCQVSEQDLPLLLLQRVARLRVKNLLNARYLYWNLASKRFLNWINKSKTDPMIPHMAPKDINDFIIAFPPVGEQEGIALFLDNKTSEIDQAIAIKKQQIALLNERKQIVIQKAVTQGLDPNVPMKDSGVEWIGQIPEHWNVKKIKYATKIFRGKFTHRPRNDPSLYDGKYPFFQTGDVAKAGKFLVDFKQTLNEKGLRVSTLIPKGTVVITIAANIGDVSILGVDACFPDSIVGFQPTELLDRDFLFYSLLSMKNQFVNSSIKNTQMNLNVDRIGSNYICVCPKDEQINIVEKIEEFNANFENAINLLNREIEKLKEYKTTLINDAVTGKIKVA